MIYDRIENKIVRMFDNMHGGKTNLMSSWSFAHNALKLG